MSYINDRELKEIIKEALKEDIGIRDITTEAVIPLKRNIRAEILAKQDCVICGLGVASLVFRSLDKKVFFRAKVKDGDYVRVNSIIAGISGKARSILAAERVALNFLSLLSGVATETRKFVNAVKPYRVKIIDTRKTIPGLRELEKYAVRIGGGYNHRMKLDEMILIKDNHLKVINPKSQTPNPKQIPNPKFANLNFEIEITNLKQFKEVLKLKPDIIMLDNMSVKNIRRAVRIRNNSKLQTPNSKLKLEASGGITLNNVKKIASTGVDMISVGALTHSVDSVDISLEVL